jgi:hypothetical protein
LHQRLSSASLFVSIAAAIGVACVFASACSSTSSNAAAAPVPAPVSKDIGAQGGTVATADGSVTLQIPAGALSASTAITLQAVASTPAGAVGRGFEIGPTGTTFAQPATLTFSYAGADLGGKAETNLVVMTYGSAWIPVGSSVDVAAKKVSAAIGHLSTWDYGFTTYMQECSAPSDALCGLGCTSRCTPELPYATCTPAVVGASTGGGTICQTPASCTCAAKSRCTGTGGTGCGYKDCTVTCDQPTPYAICTNGLVGGGTGTGGTSGGGTTCNGAPTCACAATPPMASGGGDGSSGGGGQICNAQRCASGCCDDTGFCQLNTDANCGSGGGKCVACAAGSSCRAGACFTPP